METAFFTPQAVANLLGVSRATLARWRSEGKPPVWIRLGDTPQSPVRYPRAALIDWLNDGTRGAR